LRFKVKHLAEAPLPKGFEEIKEVKEAEAKADAAIKEALESVKQRFEKGNWNKLCLR